MALLCIDIYGKEPWNISFAISYLRVSQESSSVFPAPHPNCKDVFVGFVGADAPTKPTKTSKKYELRRSRNVYGAIAPTGRAHKTHKNI